MIVRKVWKTKKAGSLDNLRLVEEEIPGPGPGEVTVKIESAGLNFADIFACLGLYSATPKGEFTPGLEYAGTIQAVGPALPGPRKGARKTGWKIGDRIMGVTRFGGYTDYINIDRRYVWPLPERWNFNQGAAYPAQGLTAWYAIKELGNFKPDGVALIHSAAGGVGLLALAMIQKLKGQVIATVGRPEKVEFLMSRTGLPERQIIVRDESRFGKQLDETLEKMGRPGINLILDSLAGPYFQPGLDRLLSTGRLIVFGAGNMMPTGSRPNYLKLAWQYLRRPRLDPLNLISENKSLMAFNLIWLWDRVEELTELLEEMSELKLKPPHVGHNFPLEEAPEAMRLFQSGQTVGKVVLETGKK